MQIYGLKNMTIKKFLHDWTEGRKMIQEEKGMVIEVPRITNPKVVESQITKTRSFVVV